MIQTARYITVTTRLTVAAVLALIAVSLALSVSRAAQTSTVDPGRGLRDDDGKPDLQHLGRALDVTGVYTVYLPFIARTVLSPTADLLYNGGFENEFHLYRNTSALLVADGWTPWWVAQQPDDPSWKNRRPEWTRATLIVDPLRVRTGGSAQQYFTFWGTHIGGVYQRVMVPANVHLIFSVWGHAWSSDAHCGCCWYRASCIAQNLSWRPAHIAT